jgi:hypothetical protein
VLLSSIPAIPRRYPAHRRPFSQTRCAAGYLAVVEAALSAADSNDLAVGHEIRHLRHYVHVFTSHP